MLGPVQGRTSTGSRLCGSLAEEGSCSALKEDCKGIGQRCRAGLAQGYGGRRRSLVDLGLGRIGCMMVRAKVDDGCPARSRRPRHRVMHFGTVLAGLGGRIGSGSPLGDRTYLCPGQAI